MRRVLFVVNDLETLRPEQSSADLMAACATQLEVWVTTTTGFAVTPSGASVGAWPFRMPHEDALVRMRGAPRTELLLERVDAVWVRTNPGRDVRPASSCLQLLLHAHDTGLLVRNSPRGLIRAASKLHLGSMPPGTIPRTWSSDDPERLSTFLDELGGSAVLKPSVGTRGDGVVRLSRDTPNRAAILAEAVVRGPALLQDYLPEAPAGDTRIHVVGGELLEIDGHPCAVQRVPAAGEWRSNVALGGTRRPTHLTDAQRALVAQVGPLLAEQGLWHVGLDVVGDKVVECNVFSPGGLRDASKFTGVDFTTTLVSRFLSWGD